MGWIVGIFGRHDAKERDEPVPPEPLADEAPDADYRLERLRESYCEVLAATKHEDDKVGRFLGVIAFLVAGALIFAQQADVLRARYDLGVELALPALALAAFLFFITLAVLLYVLAIAAPVTIPPGSEGEVRHSHLFFLLIAQETKESWGAQWDLDKMTLREKLTNEYRGEILNLGQRTHNKRRRSEEASALFAAALLFFGLTVGWSIDVIRTVTDTESPQWSFGVRAAVAAWLAAFAALILYQRFRVQAVRRIELRKDEGLRGYGRMTAGLALGIALLLLPPGDLEPEMRGVLAVFAVATLLIALSGLRRVLASPTVPAEASGVWLLVFTLVVLAAGAALWLELPALQLLLALVLALGPLTGQVTNALDENDRLRGARRKRAAELKGLT